jgi:hypothetical protein
VRRHPRTRRTAAVAGAVAFAVLGSVAIWLQTGSAQAATKDDPTCASAIGGTPVTDVGASPTGFVLNVGGASELGQVYDPPGNPQAAFPTASSHDIVGPTGANAKQVDVQFGEGLDSTTDNTPPAYITSTDGAVTFPTSSKGNTKFAGPYTTLRDGSLLGVDFKPVSFSGTTTTFRMYRSTDNGATWTSWDAVAETGAHLLGEGRTHRAPLELADGRILVSFYASVSEDNTSNNRRPNRAMVAISSDGGHSFPSSAPLAKGTDTNMYNEAAVAQLNNGNLVSVIRHHTYNTSSKAWDLSIPVEVTSTNGTSWSAPANLSVTFPHGYDPYDDSSKALLGVAPNLTLAPNGILVLSSGRPDNWVAMSTNGAGTGWVGEETYRNCPTSGNRLHGSTGNTGLTSVQSNRIVQVGDNCDVTWACPSADTGFTVAKEQYIWRRFVDVLTPDVGKIDLASKYHKNKVHVDTNMTFTTATHPRTGVAGAFDGSTEYWSSAVSANSAGHFTVTLDKQYDLTRIGLALRNGRAESATVSLSTDGSTWTTPVNVADRTDLAVNYQAFATPQPARYVRVDIPATSTCDGDVASSCAFLNELELYSTTDSFENDPLNTRPRGYTELSSSWVTNTDTDDSSRALRIIDGSTTTQARAAGTGPAAPNKTLEFRVNPVALPHSFLIDVRGRNASGTTVTPYQFVVNADGSLGSNTGTWHTLTAPGAVPIGQWSSVSIAATLTAATFSVNGTAIATTGLRDTGATALSGFVFASNGAQATGDNIVVDDVTF